MNFIFFHKPIEIIGDNKVESIKFEKIKLENSQLKGTGEIFKIDCGLVITAIGYQPRNILDLKISKVLNCSLLYLNYQIPQFFLLSHQLLSIY